MAESGQDSMRVLGGEAQLELGDFAWAVCKNLPACGICAICIFIPTALSKKNTSRALPKIYLQNSLHFQKDKVIRTARKPLPCELPSCSSLGAVALISASIE